MTHPIITKNIKWFFLISALVLVPGIFSLVRFGLRASIDFSGGTIIELKQGKGKQLTRERVTDALHDQATIQSFEPGPTLSIRMTTINSTVNDLLIRDLKKDDPDIAETRYETVGPILGKELILKTVYAILLSIVLIAIYLGSRFSSLQYGVSAALATIHDALVVLGIFSLLGHFLGVEVDILFVTALLTILSFSVHDTIIVYDRIREQVKKKTNAPFEDLVNQAAIETLSRSIRNSLAIILMLLTVFLLTTGSLHWFVLALLVGTITGTYSSTCVALPLLVIWNRLRTKFIQRQKSV